MKQATLPFGGRDPPPSQIQHLPDNPPSSLPTTPPPANASGDAGTQSWPSTPPPSVAPASNKDQLAAHLKENGGVDPSSLHPLFRPKPQPQPQTQPQPAEPDPDADQSSTPGPSRPTRSSRAKAPVSYREDLKAVLRADAKLEASLLKDQAEVGKPKRKRPSRPGSASASSLVDPAVAVTPKQNGDIPELDGDDDGGDIEIVHSNMAGPSPAFAADKPKRSDRLSLDVRGTISTKPDVKPHPFFAMRDKAQRPPPPAAAATPASETDDEMPQLVSKGKAKARPPPAPLPPMRQEPPRWSLFAQKGGSACSGSAARNVRSKAPLEAAWPGRGEAHVRNLWPPEEQALQWAKQKAAAYTSDSESSRKARQERRTAGGQTMPDVPLASRIARQRIPINGTHRTTRHCPAASSAEAVRRQIDLSAWASADGSLPSSFQHLLDLVDRHTDRRPARTSQHLLNDAFRPQTASECLGNESSATYMRDWLRALLVTAPGPATGASSSSGTVSAAQARADASRAKSKRRKLADRASGPRMIQKRVDKKRRRARRIGSDDDEGGSEMADFIVDDSEEEEAWFDQFRRGGSASTAGETTEDEVAALAMSQGSASAPTTQSQSQSQAQAQAQLQPNPGAAPVQPTFASAAHLTNCLLLSGPSGSGKTAAVYACAAELGYEVFELFPGMGRRSGKDLHSAVGDLGRNHMVSSGGTGGGATWRKGAPAPAPASAKASASEDALDGPGDARKGTSPAVRQSLILVEEADVLYEDDKGFWTAIVELIAESRRPVIVTCNDAAMIPASDLPIQEHLAFQRVDASTASVYLRLLAAASRGVLLDEASAAEVLRESRDLAAPLCADAFARYPRADGPVHPEMLEQWDEVVRERADGKCEQRVDLRQAINQLSLALSVVQPGSGAEPEPEPNLTPVAVLVPAPSMGSSTGGELSDIAQLRLEARRYDPLSYVHAMQWDEDPEAYGQPPHLTTAEQQLAPHMRQLFSQPLAVPPHRPGSFRYMPDFASTVIGLVGGAGIEAGSGWELEQKRAKTSHAIATLTRLLHPAPTSTAQSTATVLDYAPAIRAMSTWDDAEQAAHIAAATAAAADGEGGRSTRNSTRFLTAFGSGRGGEYVRWLPFGPLETRAVAVSGGRAFARDSM
ncbi:uncharacterized protein PFL1_06635 [Pseudozyma flocculosa PF-1]|uniref:AAA+ ATPase domain-containing protein n=2 Tax=Pseudozyma flocculosa TaxID=84751 RepID=A0A5C3FA57_9BASI|nr:uncharacterized protein PFL1_06635 [Pseudozyma flocculosa PF-1]EPQ25768.1 hypothetical protein PFL1_06635 [Pseudozyma flocculosa PF-1]SPO40535.1 uncharacterized protein PSFLO_06017 [Pseudozyma flocculosa]